MFTAGIDIGSVSTEVVILGEKNEILSYTVFDSQVDIEKTVQEAFRIALEKACLTSEKIDSVVSTGYGRNNVPFANKSVTEITCHALGAQHLFPGTKTVIDIGGQDSKAIALAGQGNGRVRVVDFIMNDKCAAGTGRFLEVMAGVLNIDIKDMGCLSQRSNREVSISSMCTVFAESEVISLIHQKLPKEDIVSGLHTAIARKVLSLVQRVPMEEEITLTGGVMKNRGVVEKLRQELLPKRINLPDEPQIAGALGAAIMAKRHTVSRT
ncbi:MAG: 2-hydroxyglutaryl-CoA dehydratase [wastewater metagenome]|nr:2-hydroxyglutaryl-CoA dehydratase [Candidatus Loosdrechtia aerotolerans]